VISGYFIDRPIFASVISAFILIAGLAALRALPVAQYPDILPPQVEVNAFYPGANAETVAQTVAAPLDQAINGVEGMLYLRSASAGNGFLSTVVTFAIGTDADLAAINVQNRVQSALASLPEEVRRQGVQVRKSQMSLLMILALDSDDPRFDSVFISNYALLNVVDELRRVPGIGDVQIFGSKDYSIRVWLRPDVLAKLGLTPHDVAEAIREQNAQFAAGRVGQEPMDEPVDFTFSVTTQGRLETPEQFGEIVVSTSDTGGIVRLADVARVELGSREYDFAGTRNGRPTVPLGIFLQPGANALEVGDAIRARLDELSADFPPGMSYSTPYDTTTYIKVSVREVLYTLVEAMALVFVVVFVFLQNWRATIIPMLAVPVSLVGTLAAMLAFGFSINTLTLFGMVLAIGIVVDDAIVVLENVERIMAAEGLGPREATHRAMQQVTRPVIAIVFVLTAVFLPVAFLGGLVGEMYRQFAVTIAVSVAISGFVALTLTPALCATVLRREDLVSHGVLQRFNDWFARMTGRYAAGVRYLLRHTVLAVALIAAMLVATLALFRVVPGALAPKEDQGYIMVMPILQDAASLSRTEAVNRQITQALMAHPAVDQVVAFSGLDALTFTLRTNTGISWVSLKDWSQRKSVEDSAEAVAAYVFGAGTRIKDAIVLAFEPPPIEGLSMTGGFDGYVQSRSGGTMKELEAAAQALVAAASQRKELANVTTTFSASVPQVKVVLDREQAKLLGVKVSDVFDTLQSTFGALYVNDFNRAGARVPRAPAVRGGLPRAARGHPQRLCPLGRRADDPADGAGHRARDDGAGGDRALQRLPLGQGARRCGAGLQLRRSPRGHGGGGAQCAAGRLHARVDRHLVPGEGVGWGLVDRLLRRRPHGVPGAGGAVREVVPAVRGDPRRAVRGLWRVARGVLARPGERPLFPDRPRHAGGAGVEERDPHRRVRAVEGPGRVVARRGRRRRRPAALPPDRDDLARLHPRCDAARHRRRGRSGEPAFHRHGRHRWHARRDFRRDVLRTVVLPLDRGARGGQVPRASARHCAGG
jgi:hydrophobe/amphiphile efflux-1 (HAE1) family protein